MVLGPGGCSQHCSRQRALSLLSLRHGRERCRRRRPPISTGFSVPSIGGSLQWAVSASSSLEWGYYNNSGVSSGVNISGDVAYLSESKFHPFSMVLSAGRSWGFSGLPNYEYAGLGLSQLVNVGRWNFYVFRLCELSAGDGPLEVFSGVPGVEETLGVPPVQVGPDNGQGVLTNFSPQVSNIAGEACSA